MLLLLASLATTTARADSITLDTGATIEGDLARYEFGGDCQLSVTEGELSGVILIVPCHRVQSFLRTSVRAPVPIGLQEEALSPATADAEALPVTDAAAASVPVSAAREEVAAPASAPTGASAAAATAAVEPEPFYDEPLFPADPTAPIGVAPESARPQPTGTAASASPGSGSSVSAPSGRSAPAAAPSEPTGPRMAPRMDEPSPPVTERRAVSF